MTGQTVRTPRIALSRWTEADLPLLLRGNTPEMMRFLGGPEPEERVVARHRRVLAGWEDGTTRMYRVSLVATGEAVGSVVCRERDWRGAAVLEAGWSILTTHQGRGLATEAVVALVAAVRAEGWRRPIHVFPGVENAASNGVCRKVGFRLRGPFDSEYPPGSAMRCNDWVSDPESAWPPVG